MRTPRTFRSFVGIPMIALGALLLTGQASSAQNAPAGFKSPPVGTEINYGSWRCRVIGGGPDETVCMQGEQRARLYGGIFAHGQIDRWGFGGAFGHVNCLGFDNSGIKDVYPLGRLTIGPRARKALASLWPMKVGKKARYSVDVHGQENPLDIEVEITGTETLKIAGETRKTFVLKGGLSTMTGCDGQITNGKQTWWYDAERSMVVKYAHVTYEGLKPSELAFKLRSVRRPPSGKGFKGIPMAKRPDDTPRANIQTAKADKAAPVLTLPRSLTANGPVVELRGRVEDQSNIVELTVAGQRLPVGRDGSFTVRRGVPPGKTELQITAVDEWGNIAQQSVKVTRQSISRVATNTAEPLKPRITETFTDIDFGRYHALVIGNNDYRTLPDLDSAVADADAVSEMLERDYGFRVTKIRDATRSNILGRLAKYRATLKPDDNLLIYYAGHGILDKETQTGYWLPTDAEATNPSNWISTSDVTTMLRGLRSQHVLVVADSCYSGTLVRAATVRLKSSRERGAWLKRMRGKRARTALVSGGLEPVVDGGGGKHSVFAKAFIDALRENTGVLEGQVLFDRIKRPVVLNADQTPQYSDIRMAGHEGGDFMFVRKP